MHFLESIAFFFLIVFHISVFIRLQLNKSALFQIMPWR